MSTKAALAAAMILTACTGAAAHDARDSATSAATPAPVTDAVAPGTVPPGAIAFVTKAPGNVARYRVREQLVGHDLPNDAVGETNQIKGVIVVDSTGTLVPGASTVGVSVVSLKSDQDRRDGYVRGRLLETDHYPTVTFAPTAVRNLPAGFSPSTAGPVSFDVVGNLTVHGATRPTTWHVTARQSNGTVTGTATTRFTFADFGLDQPRVPVLLSVADTIGLEYDFTFARDTSNGRRR